MKKEVLEYINSMEGFSFEQRTQVAIVSLLHELVNKDTVNEPVAMALDIQEEVKLPKKRGKKKEV